MTRAAEGCLSLRRTFWKDLMRIPRALVALVAVVMTVPGARGDTVYTERASFLDNVTDPVAYDFETASGFPAAPAAITSFGGGQVQSGSVGGAAFVSTFNAPNQALTGGLNGVRDSFQAVHLVFAQPVYGVGFDDLDLTGQLTEVAVITITRADNSTATGITANVEDEITPVFFGVTSPLGIVALDVYSADAPGLPPGSRANLIDNLVVARPIPEPAAGLAAVGLTALTLRRRRR